MKKAWILALILLSRLSFADTLYSDVWVNWTPNNKVYDVVCFSKKEVSAILKGVRVLQLNRKSFQFKDTSGEIKVMTSKDCFFEQVDPHPVSRMEFFEEIVSVKCSLNNLPFKDGDFRVLGTNVNITSIKRLRDGKVWILPTNDCTFTTQLEKKMMVEQKDQPVQIHSEFMLPGEADQIQAAQGATQGKVSQGRESENKSNVGLEKPKDQNTIKKNNLNERPAHTSIRSLLEQE